MIVPTTRDFGKVIRRKLAANPALAKAVEEETFHADIACKVHDLRKSAGLTQKQLAGLIGTTQSVISRIENADYEGHSLELLQRIAASVGKHLAIEFREVASHAS